MNLNQFSTLLLSLTLVVSCAKSAKKKEDKPSQRPNIIFIMSDDHAYQAISAYSDKLTTTPHIDRIAKEGILFTNATVTNSICAPSRATILTGKHTHINGKIDNLSPFDTTQVTFPQLFQKAGYQTAMFGKLHFGNNPKGVDDLMILPGQGSYINPDFITKNGEKINKQGYATDIITDMSIEWMDKKRDTTKPFLLMYLHKAPHRAWWPKPDKFKEYTQKTFPEPETLFDDYASRGTAAKTAEMNILKHMLLSYDLKVFPKTIEELGIEVDERNAKLFNYSEFHRMNDEQKAMYMPILDSINLDFKSKWLTMSEKEKTKWKYQRYMQDYLACISSVDDNIGRVLNYLKANNLEDNTIVVYTSDQGFYLGEHGWFDKRFMYSESFKTPLMIKWPNKIKPGITSDEMVQNLDFAQTFLEAAGIAIPDDMQGESLLPLLTGNTKEWNRDGVYYHYYEYPGEHAVKRHYGMATKDFKLIHFYHDVDEWELYDLKKDPQEMTNVYNNPEYSEIVTKLKQELKAMRLKYKDSPELDQKFIKRYNEKKDTH
ncbi:sulfatase family protein [Aestuariibaculum sediminum]|uniref:Sulfatase n=1 Tax=Aestuariibaculum sediminum TaxID=2770637 RepID=A0A8J6QAN4_9FLAO|nr:sulfatase [Aestuariibaculum sediminum]MBD0833682.1 sulfatase [Aestuariibaculum sediminum]